MQEAGRSHFIGLVHMIVHVHVVDTISTRAAPIWRSYSLSLEPQLAVYMLFRLYWLAYMLLYLNSQTQTITHTHTAALT